MRGIVIGEGKRRGIRMVNNIAGADICHLHLPGSTKRVTIHIAVSSAGGVCRQACYRNRDCWVVSLQVLVCNSESERAHRGHRTCVINFDLVSTLNRKLTSRHAVYGYLNFEEVCSNVGLNTSD